MNTQGEQRQLTEGKGTKKPHQHREAFQESQVLAFLSGRKEVEPIILPRLSDIPQVEGMVVLGSPDKAREGETLLEKGV